MIFEHRSHSLCHFVSAGHGGETFPRRHAAPFLIGSLCFDRQRPLTSVHLHPQATVKPLAGT